MRCITLPASDSAKQDVSLADSPGPDPTAVIWSMCPPSMDRHPAARAARILLVRPAKKFWQAWKDVFAAGPVSALRLWHSDYGLDILLFKAALDCLSSKGCAIKISDEWHTVQKHDGFFRILTAIKNPAPDDASAG